MVPLIGLATSIREEQYALTCYADAAEDSDNDGFTNLQEFAGTNPTDKQSLLQT